MTTVAVAMVRDEADIITATVCHMLDQVDYVIVADNLSTDGTREILDGLAANDPHLIIADDPDPAYRQSEKMTALALRARLELGADWIVPFDADEWWYSPFGRIADQLAAVTPQWLVVPATLYDHVATARDTGPTPTSRMVWRRNDPLALPKVACRWRLDMVIEQGNHGARYDGGPTTFDRLLVVRHFPYRTVDQFVRKVRNGAAAYAAMTDVNPTIGAHWRQWGEILAGGGEEALAQIFRTWYWRDDPEVVTYADGHPLAPLVRDPVGAL